MTQISMNKIKNIISSTALSIVIAGIALAAAPHAQAQEKKAVLQPKSDWSVTAMAAQTDKGYCALSRQYNKNLVLTLGQNLIEEYSLAIDFTDASLKVEKAYSITLQPGPGQIRAYEMMPISARAMVIRLGYDDSFLKSLRESGVLKAAIDGKSYHFNVSEFANGEKDLRSCMQNLKGTTKTKVASSGFSAQKIEEAPPMKELVKVAKAPQKIKIVAEPPAPKLKSEKVPRAPSPVSIERVSSVQSVADAPSISESSAPEKSVKIEMVDAPKQPIVMNKIASKISKAIDIDPVTPVNNEKEQKKQDIAQDVAAEKAAAKAKELEAKAQKMAKQRQLEEKKSLELAAKKEAEQVRLKESAIEQEQLKAKKRAESELAEQEAIKSKLDAEKKLDEQRVAQQQTEQKREEQQFAKIKFTEQKDAANKAATDKARTKVKAEKEQKKISVAPLMDEPVLTPQKAEKIGAVQDKKLETQSDNSSVAQSEIEKIRAQMAALEKENRELYRDAREARGSIDKAVVNSGNQALVKIRGYEKKLEAAKADNLSLSKEMEELRLIKEGGRLDAVVGDWDLEKSTQRYNEAEREIKRLGLLLEQQRTVHRQEKVELEEMLFDPAVTDQAQRHRLAELELKLAQAQKQLGTSGRTITSLSDMPAVPAPSVPRAPQAPMQERVALNSKSLSVYAPSGIPSIVENQREEQREINRLNDQIKYQNEALRTPLDISKTPVSASLQPVSKAPLPPFPRLEDTPARISSLPVVSSSAIAPVVVSRPAPGADQSVIQKILNKAGVGVDGAITPQGAGRYRWNSGQLQGQGQIILQQQTGSLDKFIRDFTAQSKQACQGDFALLPSPSIGNARAFEMACITPASSMSSSIVFTQQGDNIVMIGHAISADDMDVAMDVRDRIAGSL
jgi:hypothetical protein